MVVITVAALALSYVFNQPSEECQPVKELLDFNRAQNPPCAYNPWTTCPLPPSANKLAVRIEAGEKRYHAE